MLLMGILCLSRVYAQPLTSHIEQERQKIDVERKTLFDPNNPAVNHAVRVFPHIETPARSHIDIEKAVTQYIPHTRHPDNLMIFASFTMPQASLKRLIQQANKTGASVIMRGFKDNTLKATALAIRALGEQGGNIIINPHAFEKYHIHAVPTVVLTLPQSHIEDKSDQALPTSFVAIAGDVSLEYALSDIARQMPHFTQEANRYLRQIRGQ